MCLLDIVLVIAVIILIWIAWNRNELFSSNNIINDIATNIRNNGDYNAYQTSARVKLSPYMYIRCKDMYQRGTLTEKIIEEMLASETA
jgi:hypothetical protein